MTKRKRQVSDNNVSGGETDYFDEVPVDLVLGNILSRLPVKSMAKCRCVSKLWSLIIRSPNYDLLFPIKPPDIPRIFFAVRFESELLFFSSPQPQNSDGTSFFRLTRHHTKLGTDLDRICRPVRGLVCSQHVKNKYSWAVISNLITGEYVTTPKVIMREEFLSGRAVYCFGYDPTEKQFKVLCVTWDSCPPAVVRNWYHVLTLGTGNRNLLWRKIRCRTLHYPLYDNGICIHGVLFYPAMISDKTHRMVCFNVRTEEFSFFNVDTQITRSSILMNYKGKLCVSDNVYTNDHFQFWVLEDAKKHKWSKHIYPFPDALIRPVGMTGSGEIVLCSIFRNDHFYYNLKSKIIKRVRFHHFSLPRFHTFFNHVEDVELM